MFYDKQFKKPKNSFWLRLTLTLTIKSALCSEISKFFLQRIGHFHRDFDFPTEINININININKCSMISNNKKKKTLSG